MRLWGMNIQAECSRTGAFQEDILLCPKDPISAEASEAILS